LDKKIHRRHHNVKTVVVAEEIAEDGGTRRLKNGKK
jgi:hypothetical protein